VRAREWVGGRAGHAGVGVRAKCACVSKLLTLLTLRIRFARKIALDKHATENGNRQPRIKDYSCKVHSKGDQQATPARFIGKMIKVPHKKSKDKYRGESGR
jgi:hypothetical protein